MSTSAGFALSRDVEVGAGADVGYGDRRGTEGCNTEGRRYATGDRTHRRNKYSALY